MREYPPILTGDALQQIAALRDYLVRQTRDREQEIAELTVQPVGRSGRAAAGRLSQRAAWTSRPRPACGA